MKKIFFQKEKCTNCGECEVACETANSLTKNFFYVVNEIPQAQRRIKIKETEFGNISEFCNHCEDAPCIKACMAAAMQYSPKGNVFNDPDKCVGCWMCVMVCPFGAVRPNEELGISQKCNGCSDSQIPPCVDACLQGALVYYEGAEKCSMS